MFTKTNTLWMLTILLYAEYQIFSEKINDGGKTRRKGKNFLQRIQYFLCNLAIRLQNYIKLQQPLRQHQLHDSSPFTRPQSSLSTPL